MTGNVAAYNCDGRQFIRTSVATQPRIHHFIMNLPATAIDFLGLRIARAADASDTFRDLYSATDAALLPTIHCYCFSREKDGFRDEIVAVGV